MPRRVPQILLAMSLHFPQARRLRDGVMSASNLHGEWQLIDCELTQLHEDPKLLEGADGIILGAGRNATWLPGLAARGIPVVNCNESWLDTPGIDSVVVEWSSLAALAVQHFQQRGVSCIAFAGGGVAKGQPYESRATLMGKLVIDAGLAWTVCSLHSNELPRDIDVSLKTKGDQRLAAFLKKAPKPLGVLCEDDALAAKMCLVAARMGLRVPQDVAIIGQGDRLVGQTARPALTTIVPPGVAMGKKAAEILHLRLQDKAAPEVTWVPCTELIVRGSTTVVAGDAALERSWRELKRKALKGITIQELAELAGCTPKTFRRRFLLRYGLDPAEEIRRLRFEEACGMLLESELSVAEIGERCGFLSPSNFFNFFRRHSQQGPAEFREQRGR